MIHACFCLHACLTGRTRLSRTPTEFRAIKPEALPIPDDSRELAENLKQRLLRLLPIFESEPEVLAVYLFGSQVDGYAMP